MSCPFRLTEGRFSLKEVMRGANPARDINLRVGYIHYSVSDAFFQNTIFDVSVAQR